MTKKIVIAEDEAYLRLLIHQSIEELEDEGVEIFLAGTGTDALECITRERPELILLDVMMPGMNGFDICERVRASGVEPQPYIVLLTAKGQEYDKIRGTEAGADRYMTKPFNPDDLLDVARIVVL